MRNFLFDLLITLLIITVSHVEVLNQLLQLLINIGGLSFLLYKIVKIFTTTNTKNKYKS